MHDNTNDPPLTVADVSLRDVQVSKIPGVYVSANLNGTYILILNVTDILKKANGKLYTVRANFLIW